MFKSKKNNNKKSEEVVDIVDHNTDTNQVNEEELEQHDDGFYDEISLKDLFMTTLRVEYKPKINIDLFWIEKFFKEDSIEYKKTIGMLAALNIYINKFELSKLETEEFKEIIILHKIGESKYLNTTPMSQLTAAVYALEQEKSEEFVLAVMLHTDGLLKSTYEEGIVGRVYDGVQNLISEKAQKYIDYMTFLNLSTTEDGRLTTVKDTVFKTLTSEDRDSIFYEIITQNKHNYIRLSENIMSKNLDTN